MPHSPIVLIVEDDDSNREMYTAYLRSAGCSVLGARNGAEGLTKARRYQPHVIVTDISMPGMSGWELARALRDNERTTGIGIIAVSGRPPEEYPDPGCTQQVDVVLMKPCLPDELLREIRKLIARGKLTRLKGRKQLARATWLRERSREQLGRADRHRRRK